MRTRHDLTEMLFISLVAMLCGAQSCVDLADFAEAKEDELKEFLALKGGPPSHDTFSRLFRALDPTAFASCLGRFMAIFGAAQGAAGPGHIAIDGKVLRRSHDRAAGQSPLHMLSAFASDTGLTLGQVAVDTKSNEITALPALLKLLSLKGATITVDALHCQSKTAKHIISAPEPSTSWP